MRPFGFNGIIFLLTAGLLVTINSCRNGTDFESSRWKVKQDMSYPYRESMYADLIKNHDLKGCTYSRTVELLGEPDYDDTIENKKYIYYEILTDFGSDIDPVYTKTLVIELDRSMNVKGLRIDEWRKTE